MNLPEKVRVFGGKDNRVNSVIVLGEAGTVVVDTLVTLEDGKALKQMAEELSAGKPIIAVAITHEHFDHIAGNQFFGCSIVSSEQTRDDIVSSREDLNKRIPGLSATPPNVTFRRSCRFHLGDLTLVMEHKGGHCPGESSIIIPELGVLISGDLVFHGRTPFVASANIAKWVTALTWLASGNPEFVIPGHGEPGSKDILLTQRAWLESFMGSVLTGKQKGLSVDECATQAMAAMNISQERKQMIIAAVRNLYGVKQDE